MLPNHYFPQSVDVGTLPHDHIIAGLNPNPFDPSKKAE